MKHIRTIAVFFIFCAITLARAHGTSHIAILCSRYNENYMAEMISERVVLDFAAGIDPEYIALFGGFDQYTQRIDDYSTYIAQHGKDDPDLPPIEVYDTRPQVCSTEMQRVSRTSVHSTNMEVPIFTRNPNIGMLCKLGTGLYWNRTTILFGQDRFGQCQF